MNFLPHQPASAYYLRLHQLPPYARKSRLLWQGVFLCIVLWLMACSPSLSHAAAPKRFEIQALSLLTSDNTLTVNLSLAVDDEDGLYNLLKDGAVVELGITIDVERKRDWWSNATIASIPFTSVIRHDPLTREFFLTMPGKEKPLKDRNLTRLLSNSWLQLQLPLIPMSLIELEGRNQTYIISGSAGLTHIETPPWLAKNSVFWSAEIIPPITFSLEYFYQ